MLATKRARWLLWILLAVLVVTGIGIMVLWWLPELLTEHPPGSLSQAEQFAAENDVRTALVAFLISVGGVGTLIFTGRSYMLNRRGQQIDRYSTAVGQLNDTNTPVRIGAIHALSRVGADSGTERETVIRVLASFVRLQSVREKREFGQERMNEDVQAALDALGPLLERSSIAADLRNADLRNGMLAAVPEDRVLMNEGTALSESARFGPPTGRKHITGRSQ